MFSTNVVYDVLSNCTILRQIPEHLCREYKRVFLVAPGTDTPNSPDAINVCSYDFAVKNAAIFPDRHFICVLGTHEGAAGELPDTENVLCIQGDLDIFQLFARLQERFLLLADWERRLMDAILENSGFQRIVDESEHILKNPIAVLDASYRLLASSKHYKVDHPHMNYLEQHGYHSSEFVSILQNSGYFHTLNTTDDMIITPPESVIEYTAITKCSRQFGMFSVESGILCSHTPYSPYIKELMAVFFKYIALCDKTHSISDKLFLDGASLVLKEILEGNLSSREDIDERLTSMGFPTRGSFAVCLIEWEKHTDGYPNRLAHDLSRILKSRAIFPYKNRVFILEHAFEPAPPDFIEKKSEELKSAIAPYECLAGISGQFDSMSDLRKAYDQALQALDIGENDRRNSIGPEKKFFSFTELFLRSIFDSYRKNGDIWFDNMRSVKAVKALLDHDAKHRKNLSGILLAYLLNERNATKAGECMYMSRNNILHHVSKAIELTGLNLEDPKARLELLVAYNLLGIHF